MSAVGELWAVRITADAAEIWTENGRLVAQFIEQAGADLVVDDHNTTVEIERDDEPEAVRTREEKQSERLAEWRKHDPSGALLVDRIMSSSARLARLLSLNAPNIIIVGAVETICERAETLKALLQPEETMGDA